MTVVFDAVVFVCYNIVLSCPLIASHVENLSDMYSLVYTVNIRKITTLLLQKIRYTFCQTLCTKRDKTAAAAAGLVSSCPLLAICALSLLPVAFLSDAPTTKPMHGSLARALVNRCDY